MSSNKNYLEKLFIDDVKGCLGSGGGGGFGPIARLYGMINENSVTVPAHLKSIDSSLFGISTNLQTVIFEGKPDKIAANTFANDPSLTDIFVVWSEGEVAGYPWGAPSATVYYYSETKPTTEGNFWHYVNGEPAVWELTPQATQGLEYVPYESGGLMCVGMGTATDTNVVIPDEVNGEPVKYIAVNAFAEGNVESIILPTTSPLAFAGSLSSPSIRKIVIRGIDWDLYGPEYLCSWSAYLPDGMNCSNGNYYSPFQPVEVDYLEGVIASASTNTTLLELHVPWSENHEYMNDARPWGIGDQCTIIFESSECFV